MDNSEVDIRPPEMNSRCGLPSISDNSSFLDGTSRVTTLTNNLVNHIITKILMRLNTVWNIDSPKDT